MQQISAIKSAEFISSSANANKCPKPNFPEYAFIGRSNVGKSSLINMVAGRNLAKVSKKPGKTKLINHFLIKSYNPSEKKPQLISWYLVDLPGYGYAGVSKTEKEGWKKWFSDYFLHRENLMNTFVLIDSRIPPQNNDLDFMRWLGEHTVAFSLVFTKADKLSANELMRNVAIYKKTMLQWWEEIPPIFISSAMNKKGRDELLWFIQDIGKSWQNPG